MKKNFSECVNAVLAAVVMVLCIILSQSLDEKVLTMLVTLATTFFTALTAWASLKSAKASERALTEIERPWICLDIIHLRKRHNDGVNNNWFISFEWKNVGRSPAIIQDCKIKFSDKKKLSTFPDYTNSGSLSCQHTVSANTSFNTSEAGPGFDITDEDAIYVVYGELFYSELNGKKHRTGFAVEVPAYMLPALVSGRYPNENYTFHY